MKLHKLCLGLFLSFVLCTQAQITDFSSTNFTKADKLARQNFGASLDNLPALVAKLTLDLKTDQERYRAIFVWVCQNIENDYKLYAKNKRKRKRFEDDSLKLEQWNTKFKKKVFYTLLKKQRTICTGYAYIVKTLCDLADIECYIVDGFGKTSTTDVSKLTAPNHSWNAVKLNNKWYLSDPTWASGIQNTKNGRFEFYFNNGLFLVSPNLFALSHYPIYNKWLLLDKPPSFKDFIDAPIIYGETYNYIETLNTPNTLYNNILKGETISIKLKTNANNNPKHFTLQIDNGNSVKTVTPEIIKQNATTLEIKHQFKSRGFYDTHLLIDKKLIASFVYKVKREKR